MSGIVTYQVKVWKRNLSEFSPNTWITRKTMKCCQTEEDALWYQSYLRLVKGVCNTEIHKCTEETL